MLDADSVQPKKKKLIPSMSHSIIPSFKLDVDHLGGDVDEVGEGPGRGGSSLNEGEGPKLTEIMQILN